MKRYYIGIDLGGTNTRIAFLGKRFDILQKESFPTNLYKGPNALLSAIDRLILRILRERSIQRREIYGIGIGIAGLLNTQKGIVHKLINIDGWEGFNITNWFEKRLKIRAYADNDANVMALAELYKGAGRGSKNLVCLTLGTGVGGGIVIDGRLYRGPTYSAGEIGHIPISEEGPVCNCGGRACIESYVGKGYLVKALKRSLKSGRKTVLREMLNRRFSLELVDRAAKAGDRLAIDFWHDAGVRIGIMLSGVINLLNPDKVIIGGGIANAGRFLFDPIRKTVKERAMEMQRRHVRIVKAKLGRDAGVVGAAVLVSIERDK